RTRLSRKAGVRGRACKGPPRRPTKATPDGRTTPEAPRARQDHDGEVDSADRGGADRQALSEHGGPQFVLGRGRRDAQVLRGDPRRPEPPRDPERPEDQLDLQSREPRARLAVTGARGGAGRRAP